MSDLQAEKVVIGYMALSKDLNYQGYQLKEGEYTVYSSELPLLSEGFSFTFVPVSRPAASTQELDVWEIEVSDIFSVIPNIGIQSWGIARRIKPLQKVIDAADYKSKITQVNYNTGWMNCGCNNTGSGNFGNRNTGNFNTGHGNTGVRNLGDDNSGAMNIGWANSGYSNITNYSAGYFCIKEPTVVCFDVDTGLPREIFLDRYSIHLAKLCFDLISEEPIDLHDLAEAYKEVPGVTVESLTAWRAKYVASMDKYKQQLKSRDYSLMPNYKKIENEENKQ